MPRLILDLSTSLMWQGKPSVGMVRVERELARALLARTDIEGAFVHLERESRIFHEIGRERARAIIDAVTPPVEPAASDPDSPRRRAGGVKHLVLRLVAPELKSPLRDFGVAGVSLLVAIRDWITGRQRRARAARRPPPLEAQVAADRALFRREDLLLLTGLGCDFWDDELCRVKQATGTTIVHIVHDVIPYLMPEYCAPKMPHFFLRYMRNALQASDAMLAVSHSTRRDLQRFCLETGAPERPIDVVRHGCDIASPGGEVRPELAALSGSRFLLYVSTLEPRKNHALLISLWRDLYAARREETPVLVLVGDRGWRSQDLLDMLESSALYPRFIRIHHGLHDGELAWLYRNCVLTLYPSLYEGWGLPISESLAHGKVCIAANVSSMPEAADGFGILLAPLDGPGWYETICRLLDDDAYRASLELSIRTNYRAMSWKESSSRVLDGVIARWHRAVAESA
jgi:glycosyltransferase involved in cell wall biosynthesis